MKSKELSVELRDIIFRRQRSGEGDKTISRVLKVTKSTVSSIIRKWKEKGTNQTLPRAGCLTKLSNQARMILLSQVTKNPMTTLTELQSSLAELGETAEREKQCLQHFTNLSLMGSSSPSDRLYPDGSHS